MKTAVPKQFLHLSGKPILVHTVAAFSGCSCISQIIVVVPEDKIAQTSNMLAQHFPAKINIAVIAGGRRRQDSVYAGLRAVNSNIDIVLVHDGARPLVTPALIERCFHKTVEKGAVIAAVQVKDTLKKEAPGFLVGSTVERDLLWQAQTPQGARKELLQKAFAESGSKEVTDESALLENSGIPVHLVSGEVANIKITTPEDMDYAERIISKQHTSMRIGHGFDAHRFISKRKLILGGVEVDHDLGLAGHSDADVVTHALCDAILGAIGKGDIGHHFPDNDPAFKDINSLLLLKRVVTEADNNNFTLVNSDITIVCQAPRLAPYIDRMRTILATCCKTDPSRINVKATTTEKMGFTGRQEGISCHAVTLLEQIKIG